LEERPGYNLAVIKVLVNIADKQYTAELDEEEILHEGRSVGYGLIIKDNKTDQDLGCIIATISVLTLAHWRKIYGSDTAALHKVIKNVLVAVLPKVFFPLNIHDVHNMYPKCLLLEIGGDQNGFSLNDNIYHIKPEDSPEKIVRRIVYDGQMDDLKIRRGLLQLLYDHWKISRNTKVLKQEIIDRMFVPEEDLLRNLELLTKQHKVDLLTQNEAIISACISSGGVEYVENNFEELSRQTVMGDQIMGDKITASTSGDNSPVIIQSSDTSITYNLLDNIRKEIESEYKEEDKEELLQEVKEIKELLPDTENNSTVLAKLGGLLSKVSKYGKIALLILKLIKTFHGS